VPQGPKYPSDISSNDNSLLESKALGSQIGAKKLPANFAVIIRSKFEITTYISKFLVSANFAVA
jgi:hypothetical protein